MRRVIILSELKLLKDMDEYTSHTDELFHVTVSQFIEPFNNNDKQ
ncbi:hypothetical protein PROSTU_00486 [Providencia stuartii ATCC 25827]|uniref:Uncharacterized protein n=1 Tax=Providencia stuartii ATCC 25827 TaxID=471874 RepID=A0AA86YPC9_PROST|nr:hypothetical protein PROSTU_00486 [Providencia stuartii ATCC 25827]